MPQRSSGRSPSCFESYKSQLIRLTGCHRQYSENDEDIDCRLCLSKVVVRTTFCIFTLRGL